MAQIRNYIRGDSRVLAVSVVDSSGNPVDITGGTVFFTLNATQNPTDDSGAVISKTVTSHTAPTLGQTQVTLTNTDTQSLTPGQYYYDIQYKDTAGNITSTKADVFQVIGDVTRRIV
jgi:hypothetical protein